MVGNSPLPRTIAISAELASLFFVLAKSVILSPITKSKSSSVVSSLPSGVAMLFTCLSSTQCKYLVLSPI